MTRHLTRAELQAGLPEILESPQDDGCLEGIVIRPDHGRREELESCEISLARGTHGDHWAKGCWMTTEEGKPHPDVQICIMNARCIALVAQARARWALAGDNLFIDMDLRPDNLPPGHRRRGDRNHRRAPQRLRQFRRALRQARRGLRQRPKGQGPAPARYLCPGGARRPGERRRSRGEAELTGGRRYGGRDRTERH
jgi:hypothetical protein